MSAFDPNRPPATGPEWNGSRASDVPVEPGGPPNPLEAKKSNDDPPFDFAPPEDILIDDDVCVDEWMAEAPDEPPTGNWHDPDPADAGKLNPIVKCCSILSRSCSRTRIRVCLAARLQG